MIDEQVLDNFYCLACDRHFSQKPEDDDFYRFAERAKALGADVSLIVLPHESVRKHLAVWESNRTAAAASARDGGADDDADNAAVCAAAEAPSAVNWDADDGVDVANPPSYDRMGGFLSSLALSTPFRTG